MRFRFIAVLVLTGILLAFVQKGAWSRLKPVPVEEVQAPEESVSEQPLPEAADTGADKNRFYDPANPDHEALQKGEDMRATLPLDKRGAIDWMKALRSGAIAPRADLQGKTSQQVLDLDVILKNTKEMPHVRFPHNSHTEWLACSNCHDSLFVPKAGANPITMEKIFRGEYCGACHDRVAFVSHFSCERCHSVPHANSRQWW